MSEDLNSISSYDEDADRARIRGTKLYGLFYTTGRAAYAIGQLPNLVLEACVSLSVQGTPETRCYAIERYGHTIATALQMPYGPGLEALMAMHLNINAWTDEQALAWKSSQLANYNAVSVAGAIFATIGVTALQLQPLSQAHWVARAFLSTSVPVGTYSLVLSTWLQQTISSLNTALSIRLWLSRGRPYALWKDYPSIFNHLPLEASLSAMYFIGIPTQLLQFAALLFVAGFCLFVLFSWLGQTPSSTDDRNIFIFFITIFCAVSLHIVTWMGLRRISQARTSRHYSSQPWSDLYAPAPGPRHVPIFSDEKRLRQAVGLDKDGYRPALQSHLWMTLQVVQNMIKKQSLAKNGDEAQQVVERYKPILGACLHLLEMGGDEAFDSTRISDMLRSLASDSGEEYYRNVFGEEKRTDGNTDHKSSAGQTAQVVGVDSKDQDVPGRKLSDNSLNKRIAFSEDTSGN